MRVVRLRVVRIRVPSPRIPRLRGRGLLPRFSRTLVRHTVWRTFGKSAFSRRACLGRTCLGRICLGRTCLRGILNSGSRCIRGRIPSRRGRGVGGRHRRRGIEESSGHGGSHTTTPDRFARSCASCNIIIWTSQRDRVNETTRCSWISPQPPGDRWGTGKKSPNRIDVASADRPARCLFDRKHSS